MHDDAVLAADLSIGWVAHQLGQVPEVSAWAAWISILYCSFLRTQEAILLYLYLLIDWCWLSHAA